MIWLICVFAFDSPNYSRYLVWLGIFLTNIDDTNPGAKELQKNISSMFSTSMEEMEQTLSLLSLQEGLVASFICLGHMKDGAEQH